MKQNIRADKPKPDSWDEMSPTELLGLVASLVDQQCFIIREYAYFIDNDVNAKAAYIVSMGENATVGMFSGSILTSVEELKNITDKILLYVQNKNRRNDTDF